MGNYVSDSTRADPHDGKTKITPELIYTSLASQKKGLLLCGCVFGFCALLCSGMFLAVLGAAEATGAWVGILRALLIIAPFAIVFGFVFAYRNGLKRLKDGRYTIITDTVERVVEDDKMVREYHRSHVRYRMEHAMYLTHCGRVVISLSDTYTNSKGDLFYVVVDKEQPNVPHLLYNAKYYELQMPKQ